MEDILAKIMKDASATKHANIKQSCLESQELLANQHGLMRSPPFEISCFGRYQSGPSINYQEEFYFLFEHCHDQRHLSITKKSSTSCFWRETRERSLRARNDRRIRNDKIYIS
ncbi:hypothetical protein HNY73_015938 [Argiope bruennichi]|uniref:Uncharacterized protein n=1 Tax=Argiope bruennichi TaxID=94029 RepID=A0A8T0EL75_ARGBR|nr:hypothetical protein HNY73_015938 [Argiope bruennichi]